MRPFHLALILLISSFAHADLIPPDIAAAQQRLRDNPKLYDRVDQFCHGKQPQDACQLPGKPFAGGGEGTCVNQVNESNKTIDMTCERNDAVTIDRKLPQGGFVGGRDLCPNGPGPSPNPNWGCKPITPTPADQFCQGKKTGASCTVELEYQGKPQRDQGVCTAITETDSFYYQGHRSTSRQVIRCEPTSAVKREMKPASWWEKVKP